MQTRLYCHSCQKTYDVDADTLEWVRRRQPERFERTDQALRYRGGCFFKELAALKRLESAALSRR